MPFIVAPLDSTFVETTRARTRICSRFARGTDLSPGLRLARVRRLRAALAVVGILGRVEARDTAVADPCAFVDPFIGTDGGGNVVPGPCLPFGMVKLSPDCDLVSSNSGYVSGRPILGSVTFMSAGPAAVPNTATFCVMATTGEIDPGDHASPVTHETASPGFYGGTLSHYEINVALTATRRTGFHECTFSATDRANLLIDAGSFLGQKYSFGEDQELVASEVRILSDTTAAGYSRVRGGWNKGDAYTVYFHASFDRPALANGTWKSGRITPHDQSEYDSGERALQSRWGQCCVAGFACREIVSGRGPTTPTEG